MSDSNKNDVTTKPEVYPVTVQLYGRCPQYPDGKVASGFFTFVDGVVTITHWDGSIAEDPHGKVYTRKLDPGATFADAESAARFLFRDFRLSCSAALRPVASREVAAMASAGRSITTGRDGADASLHLMAATPQRIR
jgi:hypothetical protein